MKPAFERKFDLEFVLGDLRRQLAAFAYDGVKLDGGLVRDLVALLAYCRDEAAAMARELSRQRWNGRAATDPLADIVVAEAARPGTNVCFFPVAARPIPGDAPQRFSPGEGGAA